MAQLMPLLLTVSCFSKIQTGFTFLVLAHLGSPGQRPVKRVCVCVQLPHWLDEQEEILFTERWQPRTYLLGLVSTSSLLSRSRKKICVISGCLYVTRQTQSAGLNQGDSPSDLNVSEQGVQTRGVFFKPGFTGLIMSVRRVASTIQLVVTCQRQTRES